ncbi:MAG: ABC transporter permease, partial [Bradyrhizobium sp.]|nr:ABC transporter permease [Bradyrhizobium sp.]
MPSPASPPPSQLTASIELAISTGLRRRAAPRGWGRRLYLAANIAVLVFLLAPIAIVIVFALNPTPFIQFPPVGLSLRWFEKFFASRDFMQALVFSLEVAAMTTLAATVLGAS